MEQKINELKQEIQELKDKLQELTKAYNIISLYGVATTNIISKEKPEQLKQEIQNILDNQKQANDENK